MKERGWGRRIQRIPLPLHFMSPTHGCIRKDPDMLKTSEIKHFIEEDRTSHKKKMAEQGLKYYEGEHKIMGSRIFYVDADGQVKEDLLRSNVRISHPFFTELADQEVQYMLSGDGNFIRSDNPDLQKQLDLYFNDSFWSEVYEMLTGCISKDSTICMPIVWPAGGQDSSMRIPWVS